MSSRSHVMFSMAWEGWGPALERRRWSSDLLGRLSQLHVHSSHRVLLRICGQHCCGPGEQYLLHRLRQQPDPWLVQRASKHRLGPRFDLESLSDGAEAGAPQVWYFPGGTAAEAETNACLKSNTLTKQSIRFSNAPRCFHICAVIAWLL